MSAESTVTPDLILRASGEHDVLNGDDMVIEPTNKTDNQSDVSTESDTSTENVVQKDMDMDDNRKMYKNSNNECTVNLKRKRMRLLPGTDDIQSFRKKKKDSEPPKLKGDNRDIFCWRCHKSRDVVHCHACPRAYHIKCALLQSKPDTPWLCTECDIVETTTHLNNKPATMCRVKNEELAELLRFVMNRMRQHDGSVHFEDSVDQEEYPDYPEYVVHPMYLSLLDKNIKDLKYLSCDSFLADVKWMVHNSYVFNTALSDLTLSARAMLKNAKQECEEIVNCPDCYRHANTLPEDRWFIEPCLRFSERPHILVWARLKGFPYWPCKVMKTSGNVVDVRFFGDHNKSMVPVDCCYLYSKQTPFKQKKIRQLEYAVQEAEQHIQKLESIFGEFKYAPTRVQLNIKEEKEQLKSLLPFIDDEEFFAQEKPNGIQTMNNNCKVTIVKSSSTNRNVNHPINSNVATAENRIPAQRPKSNIVNGLNTSVGKSISVANKCVSKPMGEANTSVRQSIAKQINEANKALGKSIGEENKSVEKSIGEVNKSIGEYIRSSSARSIIKTTPVLKKVTLTNPFQIQQPTIVIEREDKCFFPRRAIDSTKHNLLLDVNRQNMLKVANATGKEISELNSQLDTLSSHLNSKFQKTVLMKRNNIKLSSNVSEYKSSDQDCSLSSSIKQNREIKQYSPTGELIKIRKFPSDVVGGISNQQNIHLNTFPIEHKLVMNDKPNVVNMYKPKVLLKKLNLEDWSNKAVGNKEGEQQLAKEKDEYTNELPSAEDTEHTVVAHNNFDMLNGNIQDFLSVSRLELNESETNPYYAGESSISNPEVPKIKSEVITDDEDDVSSMKNEYIESLSKTILNTFVESRPVNSIPILENEVNNRHDETVNSFQNLISLESTSTNHQTELALQRLNQECKIEEADSISENYSKDDLLKNKNSMQTGIRVLESSSTLKDITPEKLKVKNFTYLGKNKIQILYNPTKAHQKGTELIKMTSVLKLNNTETNQEKDIGKPENSIKQCSTNKLEVKEQLQLNSDESNTANVCEEIKSQNTYMNDKTQDFEKMEMDIENFKTSFVESFKICDIKQILSKRPSFENTIKYTSNENNNSDIHVLDTPKEITNRHVNYNKLSFLKHMTDTIQPSSTEASSVDYSQVLQNTKMEDSSIDTELKKFQNEIESILTSENVQNSMNEFQEKFNKLQTNLKKKNHAFRERCIEELDSLYNMERGRWIQESKNISTGETDMMLEEIKRKQWCVLCLQEAKFHCCWNSSYCSKKCHLADWPIHVKSCTQYNMRAGDPDLQLSPTFRSILKSVALRYRKVNMKEVVLSDEALLNEEYNKKQPGNSNAGLRTLLSSPVNFNPSAKPTFINLQNKTQSPSMSVPHP